jgi:hypothetical protein
VLLQVILNSQKVHACANHCCRNYLAYFSNERDGSCDVSVTFGLTRAESKEKGKDKVLKDKVKSGVLFLV